MHLVWEVNKNDYDSDADMKRKNGSVWKLNSIIIKWQGAISERTSEDGEKTHVKFSES